MRTDDDLQVRARAHAALADAHRLAIVDAVAIGDRSPGQLADQLRIGTNLLAHHVQVLRDAGLVEVVASEGDRRRRYVRLRPERLPIPHARPEIAARSILFVCSANSARSPLAAALWARRSVIPAASAGTRPAERYHPLAHDAARRNGLALLESGPRGIDRTEGADLLITVCDEANEALGPLGMHRLHWSVPDPVPSGGRQAFDRTVEGLRARVEALAATIRAA